MALVKKTQLKDKAETKKKEEKNKEEDEDAALRRLEITPRALQIQDSDMKDAEEMHQQQKQNQPAHTRRIWSKRATTTSKQLYDIATTPQKLTKEIVEDTGASQIQSKRQVEQEMKDMLKEMQELNIQMKAEAEKIRSTGSSSSEQMVQQYEGLQTQIQRLAEISQRHEDELEDLRCMTDYTHELVLGRENKDSTTKMVIKAWPKEADYYDRTRVTQWLLEKAGVHTVKQEHGYYTQAHKYTLSPDTILTFAD